MSERVLRLVQRIDGINHRLQLAGRGPLKSFLDVGTIAAIAADEAMLFDEERPEIQRDSPSRSCAASHDGSVAREAIENFFKHLASNVFHNNINAAFVGDTTDFGGPFGIV